MKLMVGRTRRSDGFALPTILLVSTVMLVILAASIAATAASRVSLDSQYYNQLAQQAAQSGIARATECLKGSGYKPQWSTLTAGRDLRPNSDCTGMTMTGGYVSSYVVGQAGSSPSKLRTKYSIEAPNGSGVGSTLRVVGTTELVRTSPPHSVWRSYEQSLYLRIEPPATSACPAGFVSVPGNTTFSTRDFCISKYEAKSAGGKAVSQPDGLPYTTLTLDQATTFASQACGGCHLVTQNEWLTAMHNVLNVSSNWSGGAVGSGYIYSGHNDNSPSSAIAADPGGTDGYYGTGNSGDNQRRTLTLSNGEVIWDLAGNVWEWTAGTVSASGAQPGLSGYAWREWNTGGLSAGNFASSFPSFGTPAASSWTSTHGIGRLYSSSTESGLRGIQRGSYWNGSANAGVAALSFDNTPDTANAAIGFRIAVEPLASITCSDGFIPVPGNSMFGTNNFCVAKYESKSVGGVAKSQAIGTPWVSVSQASAITAANASCTSCRLINENEWLTIAHNVANVKENWSTGTIGSGNMYRGHSDSSPASRLAASADDNDGYNGTGNAGNNQRRTLRLSNGQIIWDFSGNVAEWTSGQVTGGQPGTTASYGWRDWNTITGGALSPSPYPAFGTPAASSWTYVNDIGRINSHSTDATARGFVRGGSYSTGVNTGVFSLDFSRGTAAAADIGFRIVEVN